MGKRTAQKGTTKHITSDSQVNSNSSYRWSPASQTFNIYFYQFSCLYITRITINNDTPNLKPPKNQNRRAVFGRPAIILLGGGGPRLVYGRPTLALNSALVPQTLYPVAEPGSNFHVFEINPWFICIHTELYICELPWRTHWKLEMRGALVDCPLENIDYNPSWFRNHNLCFLFIKI